MTFSYQYDPKLITLAKTGGLCGSKVSPSGYNFMNQTVFFILLLQLQSGKNESLDCLVTSEPYHDYNIT